MPDSNKGRCFVIMPISDPNEYEPGHFKKVYEQIFKPAIKKADFEPYRADDDKTSNSIHIRILKELLEAPMALCDLSTRNPNVLYELGIRQAFDKPVVLVQEIGTERIFDVNSISTTDYRPGRKYDEVLEDQENIMQALVATFDHNNDNESLIKIIGLESAARLPSGEASDTDTTLYMLNNIFNEVQLLKNKINQKEPIDLNNISVNKQINKLQEAQQELVMSTLRLITELDEYTENPKNVSWQEKDKNYLYLVERQIQMLKSTDVLDKNINAQMIEKLVGYINKLADD